MSYLARDDKKNGFFPDESKYVVKLFLTQPHNFEFNAKFVGNHLVNMF